MLPAQSRAPILVVDPDSNYLSQLEADLAAKILKPLTAISAQNAQPILSNVDHQPLSGLFLHANLPPPGCISLIRFAHHHRPILPIFILHDGTLPFEQHDLRFLPIQKILPKPINYTQLMNYVTPVALALGHEVAAYEEIKKNAGRNDSSTMDDDAFLPISARDFLSGMKSLFDIYVRLNANRYVKMLTLGDAFSSERVQGYLDKGVTHFYLRKESQERYLAYCDQMASAIVKNKSTSVKVKLHQTLNHGQETLSFLRNHGISETNLQYASNFITNVETVVRKLDPEKNELLRGFLANIQSYEHGVGVAMIASLLANALKIQSDRAIQIVGTAALFHDIGLEKMPDKFKSEITTGLNEEELALFQTHPGVGAQILQEVRRINPAIVQAVSEHHVRRDRKGFPSQVAITQLSPIAEIIGISDEFLRLLNQAKKDSQINIINELQLNIYPGYSRHLVDTFKLVFFGTP